MLSARHTAVLLQLLHLVWAVTDASGSSGAPLPPLVPARPPRTQNEPRRAEQVELVKLVKPGAVNLSCVLDDFLGGTPDAIRGSWERDGVEIPQSEVTVPRADGRYSLSKEFFVERLGNYSCVFHNDTQEVTKAFLVTAPAMKEVRDKPVVGYVRDSVVLTCKIHPAPPAWQWYKVNGSEKDVVNATAEPPRYKVTDKGEEVALTVMNLTEEDSGCYLCVALYLIAPAEGAVHLKVITFMEPLKPFLAIMTEVLLLVLLIVACELRGRTRASQATAAGPENGTNVNGGEKAWPEESNGVEETATRQRKA